MPSITIHTDKPITLPSNTAETVIWATTPGTISTPTTATITYGITDVPADTGHAK